MKNIGITSELHTQPLHYVLEKKIMNHPFNLIKGDEEKTADRLRKGEVDVAQISPIEYALNPGEYVVIPDVCVACEKQMKDTLLFFKEGETEFNKVAINTENKMAKLLTKILIYEKYEMEPDFTETNDGVEKLLKDYDAVLVHGDTALTENQKSTHYFDLGEEWIDFTGLPLITSFLAAKNENIDNTIVDVLQKSRNAGVQYIPEIIKNSPIADIEGKESIAEYFQNNYTYQYKEEYKESLKKLWEYAFYYAEIEHIPNLIFYSK